MQADAKRSGLVTAPQVSIFTFRRYALSISIAAALLAGCGAPRLAPLAADDMQPAIAARRAVSQKPSHVIRVAHGRDLLYVSSDLATEIYTYPHGKAVSSLGGSTGVICSNVAGDVFLSQVNVDFIDEFQHGRSTPVAELSDPFSSPRSCSTDPTSGKLVVVSSAGEGVAIFRPGKRRHWHLPKIYALAQNLVSCGYDASGDLFTDSDGQDGIIYELPKGGSKFEDIVLNYNLTSPGTVQWDGQYLAVGDQGNTLIRRFSIAGSQGTQIGSVTLSGASSLNQFWIQDSIVIGADESNSEVRFWKYPDGGSEIKALKMYGPLGATISRPN